MNEKKKVQFGLSKNEEHVYAKPREVVQKKSKLPNEPKKFPFVLDIPIKQYSHLKESELLDEIMTPNFVDPSALHFEEVKPKKKREKSRSKSPRKEAKKNKKKREEVNISSGSQVSCSYDVGVIPPTVNKDWERDGSETGLRSPGVELDARNELKVKKERIYESESYSFVIFDKIISKRIS